MKFLINILLALLILTSSCSLTPDLVPAITPIVSSVANVPTPRSTLEYATPILNIRYNNETSNRPETLCLDIYPANGTNLPVVLFVHGGGWFRGDKSGVDLKPATFNSRGFIFVSINYRLIPEVDVTQQMQDITKAVAWVKENILQYGGDPSRIILLGHSAGAHMVALLGTDETYLFAEGLTLKDITGIISLDTQTYDLIKLLTNINEETGGEVYWETFGRNPEFWKQMSPTWHISSGKDIPPFFIAYTGEKQSREVISTYFFNALETADIPAVLLPVTDKTHGQLNRELGLSNDYVTIAIFDWLEDLLY
jgi:arylformamidase